MGVTYVFLDFFLDEVNCGFSRVDQKDFSKGVNSGEILFYKVKTKKTTFFY